LLNPKQEKEQAAKEKLLSLSLSLILLPLANTAPNEMINVL